MKAKFGVVLQAGCLTALLVLYLRLVGETVTAPVGWATRLGTLSCAALLAMLLRLTARPFQMSRASWILFAGLVSTLSLGAVLTPPSRGVRLFGSEDKALLLVMLGAVALGALLQLAIRLRQRRPLLGLTALAALYVVGGVWWQAAQGANLGQALVGLGPLRHLPNFLQPAFLAMGMLGLATLSLWLTVLGQLRQRAVQARTLSGAVSCLLALLACLVLYRTGTRGWGGLATLPQERARGNVLALSAGTLLLSASSQADSYLHGAWTLTDGRSEDYETRNGWSSADEAAFPHQFSWALAGDQPVEVDQLIVYGSAEDTSARAVELLGAGPEYPPRWKTLGRFELAKKSGPQVFSFSPTAVAQLQLSISSNWGAASTHLREVEVSGPRSRSLAVKSLSVNLLDFEGGARLLKLDEKDSDGAENLLEAGAGLWKPEGPAEVVVALPGPDTHLVSGLVVSFPEGSGVTAVEAWAASDDPGQGFSHLGVWPRRDEKQLSCLFGATRSRYLKVRVSGKEKLSVARFEAYQPPLAAPSLPAEAKVGGLLGSYYEGGRFGGHRQDVVEPVNFEWESPPAPLPSQGYGVTWRGYLKVPQAGRYRLVISADDGVRLTLNGQTVVNRLSGQVLGKPIEAPLLLPSGWLPLEMSVVNEEGKGGARLWWARDDGKPVPVPADHLASQARPPRRSPRIAAQDGVDWLAPAALAWQNEHRCFGCHVQAQAMMGLGLAARNDYRLDPAYPAALGSFLSGDVGPKEFTFDHSELTSAVQYVAMGLSYLRRPSPEQVRLAQWLAEHQAEDGSLANDRTEEPIEQGDLMVTANTVRAWKEASAYAADPKLEQCLRKAAGYLSQAKAETTQDHCHRLLGLATLGDNTAVPAALEAIWALQREDGGWAERPELESNGFATGQALYALKVSGVSVGDARFQRGVRYLVENQRVFGSWPAVHTDSSRPSEYAPTMWAVIGLAGSFEALVIDLVQPEEGQTVPRDATERPARAEVLNYSDEEVAGVTFALDGKPLGAADTSVPYSVNWKSADLKPGPHEITAEARSRGGKTSSARRRFTVAGDLAIAWVAPEAKARLAGPVELKSRVSNETGQPLKNVSYALDGQPLGEGAEGEEHPLAWNARGVSVGAHELKVTARTRDGQENSATLAIEVQEALKIKLKAPPEASQVVPLESAVTNLTGVAQQSLVYEAGGKLLGSGEKLDWDVSGLPPGPVEVTATVTLVDGSKASDKAVITVVRPVEGVVCATVTDARGRHLTDLKAEDFEVSEDGVVQKNVKVSMTTRETRVSMVVVIDHSGSMVGLMEGAKEAARHFVDLLQPNDSACLVAFSDRPRKVVDFTADRARLKKGIATLEPRGGTALYDSVDLATDLLSGISGRRAIILLTDGKDENDPGTAPGSSHTLKEALEGARRQDCILYSMGLGAGADREVLTRLSQSTGGRAYFPPTVKDLQETYAAIASEIRAQYELRWTSSNGRRDGKWRKVQVKLRRPGLQVFSQQGYQAPDR